ncbi:MAG: hypothetical protein ABI609_14775 [Acidobacteriota bacterium]
MTYRRILLTATMVGLLPAAAALAQATNPTGSTTPPPADSTVLVPATAAPSTITVTGQVVSTTSTEVVMQTDAGQRLTLATDSATSMPALTAGDRVSARYSTLLNGSYHAEGIALSTTGASSAASDSYATSPSTSSSATTDTRPSASKKASMPKTASSLPLVTLIGLIAGLGAAALHRKQRNA